MLKQRAPDRPDWQDNYKSMSPPQLVAELDRIAKTPHFYDNRIKRQLYLTTELVLRAPQMPTPMLPIIVLENEPTKGD
jgi:hypothetical protein